MTQTSITASPLCEAEAAVLIHAARTGAARVLGAHRAHLVDDAAASALLGVVRAVTAGRALQDPVGYAAVAGENAARDVLRRERRLARLRSEFALHCSPDVGAAWRWADCERVLLVAEVTKLAVVAATRSPSAGMRAVACALRATRTGGLDVPAGDAARRRLSRGCAHLRQLLRSA